MAKKWPSLSDYLTNLNQPMPLKKKMTRLTINVTRRVIRRQSCCGNHGEPGCWKSDDSAGSAEHHHHHDDDHDHHDHDHHHE